MVSAEKLKDIIISNEDFILNEIKKIVHRENICFPSEARKVNIIYGVRRSGKTFLLYDLFQRNRNHALYFDFEDERISGMTAQDLEKIKESFFELKPHLLEKQAEKQPIFFLLDEIQNVEGWEKFARRAAEKDGISVFVAGSSSAITPRKIHSSLRGRAWSIEISPFSFTEYIKAKNIKPITSPYGRNKIFLKKYLHDYLKWGGFPEIASLQSDFEKNKVLKEYLDAMFFKDLVERYQTTNILLLETLKESLFSAFSAKFSLSSFYKNFKDKFPFSKDSLFSYYKYFLESMLIFEARIFSPSAYKRMRNLPKIYLVDTGLARKVKTADSGRLLENAVFLSLKRKNYDIYYFEEKSECDFVAKIAEGEYEAFQVTWELAENNREREIKGLMDACKYLGLEKGTIITFDQEEEIVREGIRIEVKPFWK